MLFFVRLAREDSGAAMVEYAVLLGLIALVSLGILTTLGQNVSGIFNTLNGSLSAA